MRFTLNNRELAALIWLTAGLLWALTQPDIRRSLGALLKTLLGPRIVLAVLSMAAYSVGLVLVGSLVGLWSGDLTTETLVWFVATAFALLVRGASGERGFIRRAVLKAIGITVLIEGLVNLFVFGLAVELVLLPVLTFLVAVATFAGPDPQYASVAKLVNGVLAAFGVALLTYVGFRLVGGWGSMDLGALLRTLALPVWLTLGVLPFVYVVGFTARGAGRPSEVVYGAPARAASQRAST